MRSFLLPILFSCALTPVFAQSAGVDYKVYSTTLKKEVTIDDIVKDVVAGQVLIFGEQHDDSIGHLLERNIFAALEGRFGKDLVLSMEMFHRDVQYIVDEYLAGQISEKNFIKEARAWDTYKSDYRPTVEFAKEHGLPVIAANAPSRYTNLVTRKGLGALDGLSKEVKKKYIAPLPVDTLTGIYYDKFLEAMGGHTTPGMNLYQSQNFWDATMSYSIAEAMKKNKHAVVFQMNGRFHSEYHSGLAGRLERVYKKKVTTISTFAPADFAAPDWAAYAPLADYIIVTRPAVKKTEEE
ncbi:ChaN family lipoprotein [Taibaiella chishuiensis]|uniref:Putative iron-regulated protein n=1 Tax=Taibaiella chishuiensis TaxID=1434707 RepID=A0A2P8D9M7_9BACT|nr:ChaN family lipoprotein [Taibaiella chishuiensis]PSK93903.1 putative iron-regulated protein [Taibaiella chishuiensis]